MKIDEMLKSEDTNIVQLGVNIYLKENSHLSKDILMKTLQFKLIHHCIDDSFIIFELPF